MRTRSKARRRQQQQQVPPNLVEPPKDTMADNRTMANAQCFPPRGYEERNVVPEMKQPILRSSPGLLSLVQTKHSV
ncbi:hypothetical protein Tco_0731262 [Tanacetum coccineum]